MESTEIRLLISMIIIALIILFILGGTRWRIRRREKLIQRIFNHLKLVSLDTKVVNYGYGDQDAKILSKGAKSFEIIEINIVKYFNKLGKLIDEDLFLNATFDRVKYTTSSNEYIAFKPKTLRTRSIVRDVVITKRRDINDKLLIQSGNADFARKFLSKNPFITKLLLSIKHLISVSIKWKEDIFPDIKIQMAKVNFQSYLLCHYLLFSIFDILIKDGIVSNNRENDQIKSTFESIYKGVISCNSITLENLTNLSPVNTNIMIEEGEVPLKISKELFTSIGYQVKNIILEKDRIVISPYFSSIKEIIMTINGSKAKMEALMKISEGNIVELNMKVAGKPRNNFWDNPWDDIAISGNDKEIIKSLIARSDIAAKLNSMGTADINISTKNAKIACISIIFIFNKTMIELAYSLLKNLQFFFELAII